MTSRNILLALCLSVPLAACGNKGPLVHAPRPDAQDAAQDPATWDQDGESPDGQGQESQGQDTQEQTPQAGSELPADQADRADQAATGSGPGLPAADGAVPPAVDGTDEGDGDP